MPEGISVIVDDEGFANITFENPLLRGPALDKLIKIGGAETVEKSTEHGYPSYRVPEGNARAAGLLSSRPVGKAPIEVTVESAELTSGPTDTAEQLTGPGLQRSSDDPQVGTPPADLVDVRPDVAGVLSQLEGLAGTGTGTAPVEPQVDPNQPAPQGNSDEPPADPEATPADNGGQTEPAPKDAPRYPEGEPSDEWSLAELKAYAVDKGLDPHELRSKVKVLALINGK